MAKSRSNQELKRLRRIGHLLSPVVMIGSQGLSDNVLDETLRALADHELIKLKIAGEDRELRASLITSLIEATGAELVQRVGKMILIYKRATKQNHQLSNIVRFAHLED